MVGISKRRYTLLAVWVVGVSALGIYLLRQFSPSSVKDSLAPSALTRQCGPKDVSVEDEKKLAATWIANPKDLSDGARRSMVRTIMALPEQILSVLKSPPVGTDRSAVKIALDHGKWPYYCSEDARSGRIANTCLKNISGVGRVLIIGRSSLLTAEGRQRQLSDEEMIDQTLMPAIFWLAFERLGNVRDEKQKLTETEPSKSNAFSRLKSYVVGGYKFSPEEEIFYYREFGGAGTASPAFVSRTVALTAANLYCDAETFARLSNGQPEATKRFFAVMGCSFGKAWHMSEEEFSKQCPNLALNK